MLSAAASGGVIATGRLPHGALLGAGAGDNAAAALGLGARPGDVIVSLGTSGTAFRRWTGPTADPTGIVAGFADAQDGFLPLVCTLNAARVLDAAAKMLGVTHAQLSDLALSAPAGADGLVLVPYLEGERTPNKPDATGALHGLTLRNSTPAHLARAAVEGMLCAMADAVDALGALTSPATPGDPDRRRRRVGRRSGRSRRPSSAARCSCRRRRSTSPTVPPGRRPGCCPVPRRRRRGRSTIPTCTRPTPRPAVRSRYAEARDLTVSR